MLLQGLAGLPEPRAVEPVAVGAESHFEMGE